MPQPRFELGTDFGTGLRLAFPCCGTENGSYEPKVSEAAESVNVRLDVGEYPSGEKNNLGRHAIESNAIPSWSLRRRSLA